MSSHACMLTHVHIDMHTYKPINMAQIAQKLAHELMGKLKPAVKELTAQQKKQVRGHVVEWWSGGGVR